MTKRTIVEIPISELIEHPKQEEFFGDVAVTDQFRNSIRDHGVQIPVLVTEKLYDGKRRIISGRKRTLVSDELGRSTVPCEIRAFKDEAEEELILLVANVSNEMTQKQRRRLVEKLLGMSDSELDSTLRKSGNSQSGQGVTGDENDSPSAEGRASKKSGRVQKIARLTGQSEAQVERQLSLLDTKKWDVFYGELTDLGADDLILCRAREARADLVRRFDRGEIAARSLTEEVAASQRAARESCPKFKKPATKKPSPAKERASAQPLSRIATKKEADTYEAEVDVVNAYGETVKGGWIHTGGRSQPAIQIARGGGADGICVVTFGWEELAGYAKKFIG
ncbi:MAG TPA: ParB/RepB/Spo0J family partition protein [Candidatus Kapabacteria bacterium]|nr:ParB/RepB/Spo0J family partition protein [Candidatus Kapabacteria bacterium]